MILRLLIKVKVKVTLRGNLLFLQFDCRIAFFSRTNFLKVVHWVPAKGLVHFSAQTGGAADTWLCQSSSLPSSSSLWLSSTSSLSLPSHHHHNHEQHQRCHHITTTVLVPPRQERHHDHDPHHKIHVQFCGWLPRFAKGCIWKTSLSLISLLWSSVTIALVAQRL